MDIRFLDSLLAIGCFILLALPWVMYYRYWPRISDKCSVRRLKNGQPVYSHKRELLFVQGFLTIGILALIILLNPFRFSPVSPSKKALLLGFFKFVILWSASLCSIIPYYNLRYILSGERDRRIKLVIYLLIIAGFVGHLVFRYLGRRL